MRAVTPHEWEIQLSARLGGPVRVEYGRARTRPVLAEWRGRQARVKLHRFFEEAPPDVVADLAAWLRAGRRARGACARLDAWIDARLAALPAARPRRTVARPRGHVHDLDQLAGPLWSAWLREDFEPTGAHPRPALSWGRRARSRARSSLLLGSYDQRTRLVRIHPVLDHGSVPAWFVGTVLHHELLHAALPSARDRAGRWVHHTAEFRRREREFPWFERARAWQRRHLPALLRRARSTDA